MRSYFTEDLLYYVHEYVESAWARTLTLNDVSAILNYEEWYYERLSFTANHSSSVSLAPIVQYIRQQAAMDGLKYSTDDVKLVLDAESTYWQELG